MDTRKIAAEYRLAHWAGIMKERTESGLSIKEFCARAGFHENIYFYWQRKLRELACEQPGAHGMETGRTALVPSGFAEVKVLEQQMQATDQSETGQGKIQIDAAGIRITADCAYPTANLAELIRGLVAPC